ncbi:MAG: hypothetical protein H7Z72_21875 [Bacteroidetes bacterium]|nr:hypothetical protein [Fibrella sp.]
MKIITFLLTLALSAYMYPVQAQDSYEKQLKSLADQLAQKIKVTNKKQVAVASFVDVQGDITELGPALAEEFGVYLTDNQLEVVERRLIDKLLEENSMPQTGLLDPTQRTKLKQMAGIQIVIMGTITPLDNSVRVVLKAIDLEKGLSVGGSVGSIPRTDAINAMLRYKVEAKPDPTDRKAVGSTANTPFVPKAPKPNQDPSEVLIGEKVFDLPKGTCQQSGYFYGQAYFENTLKQDLVIYRTEPNYAHAPVRIAAGTRNASQLRIVNGDANAGTEYVFYFHTTEDEESSRRYGAMNVTIKACKASVRVITTNNMFLNRKKL